MKIRKLACGLIFALSVSGCSGQISQDKARAHCIKETEPARIEIDFQADEAGHLVDTVTWTFKGDLSMLGLNADSIEKDDPKIMREMITSLLKASTGVSEENISVDYSKDEISVIFKLVREDDPAKTAEENETDWNNKLANMDFGLYGYGHSSYVFQDYRSDLEEDTYSCE